MAETCHADRDGECIWDACPQIRDGEPAKTRRHCPLDWDCQNCGENWGYCTCGNWTPPLPENPTTEPEAE